MKLLTFTGHTSAEALKKAQQICGDEAMVVSTKEIRKKSFSTPALYEVQVAVPENIAQKAQEKLASIQKNGETLSENAQKIGGRSVQERFEKIMSTKSNPYSKGFDDVSLNLSETVKQISQIAQAAESKRLPQRDEPAPAARSNKEESKPKKDDNKDLKLIKGEIDKLNDKLKLIQHMFWDEKGPQKDGLVIPQEFAEIYSLAKNSGMYKEHLNTIMKLTLEHMPVRMRENSILIKRYFKELLRRIIYSRPELRPQGQRKIMMFVGPTGVGKTTTLAKLAARYAFLLEKKNKVGIVTLDTYRIGAVEQLMQYAKKMKLSIDTVLDPPEFVTAINSLKHCDYILIDTVGSSQYDKEKIDALREYLNKEDSIKIDVNLVVSSGTKYEDLSQIYKNFSILDIDTVIVTKLDETSGYGNIFSLMYETKKPVSYFSIGQDVPNDLLPANGDYLVECLLDGFRRGKK
ncbi:MAG: flagellar biosynthesis protein FlhF [Campylobacterales bacterium]